jgi:hypothetical protein
VNVLRLTAARVASAKRRQAADMFERASLLLERDRDLNGYRELSAKVRDLLAEARRLDRHHERLERRWTVVAADSILERAGR